MGGIRSTTRICIVYVVGNTTLDNGKHIVSLDMSTFWDGLQKLNSNVKGISGIAEFLDGIERNTKTE